jgi:tRNA nucleotidyltransferase/poly(A) polymerase
MKTIHNIIGEISKEIKTLKGKAFFVGGFVRDSFLGLSSKDIDIEVFGIEKNTLLDILNRFGKTELVGESFEVFKFSCMGEEVDFSLPRREKKTGVGHKGFTTIADPFMSPEEAASRRDFTINALMMAVDSKEVLDFFGGLNDIQSKTLKHTSPAFAEDPLRVLRAMQFAARFGFDLHPETIELCKSLKPEFRTLSKERLWIEFEKLFSKGKFLSKGIKALLDTEWFECFASLKNEKTSLEASLTSLDSLTSPTPASGLATMLLHVGQPALFLKEINTPNEITRTSLELLKILKSFTESDGSLSALRVAVGQHKKFCSMEDIKGIFPNSLELFSMLDETSLPPVFTGDDLKEMGFSPEKLKRNFGDILLKAHELQLKFNLSKEELLSNEDFNELLLKIQTK